LNHVHQFLNGRFGFGHRLLHPLGARLRLCSHRFAPIKRFRPHFRVPPSPSASAPSRNRAPSRFTCPQIPAILTAKSRRLWTAVSITAFLERGARELVVASQLEPSGSLSNRRDRKAAILAAVQSLAASCFERSLRIRRPAQSSTRGVPETTRPFPQQTAEGFGLR
jgi:hypothetical protein